MRVTDVRLRYTGAWLLLAIATSFSTVAHAGPGLNLVVRRYVRRYNRTRLHSSLGFRSPLAFERNAA